MPCKGSCHIYIVSRDLSHNDSHILSSSSALAVPLSAAPYGPPLHDLLGHDKVNSVVVLRKNLVGLASVHGTMTVSVSRVSLLPAGAAPVPATRKSSTYRHNHATTFNRSGGCHFFLKTFVCVDLGIKWWYVRGHLRAQISHSSFRVAHQPPLPGSS